MDDQEFWGIKPEQVHTLAGEWLGKEDFAGEAAAADHDRLDRPAEVALMHRSFPTYVESMWITGYPAFRLIVVSCPEVRVPASAAVPVEHVFPGAVRELPVGWRDMRSAETFRAKFAQVVASYEGMGWTRKDASARIEGTL